jgi:hypothetical protein
MPAVSKSQQRLFGMVHAYKKGKLDPKDTKDPEKIKKVAKSIKSKDAKKFAKTKHKGLPEVKEAKYHRAGEIQPEHQEKYKKLSPGRNLKYLMDLGYSKGEIESWTGKKTTRSVGWERPSDRKPKKESHQPTFKQYLVEITQKERQALIPPASVQKVIKQLMREHGTINRGVFYHTLAKKHNLSAPGLQRIIEREPWIHGIPFEDLQQQKPGVVRRDPWEHLKQKHAKRA